MYHMDLSMHQTCMRYWYVGCFKDMWFQQVLRALPAETMVDGLPRVSSKNVWRKDARTLISRDPSIRSGWRLKLIEIWYISWFPPRDIAVVTLSSELVTKTNPNLTTVFHEIQDVLLFWFNLPCFCFGLLSESSQRSPGWRFTAGCK